MPSDDIKSAWLMKQIEEKDRLLAAVGEALGCGPDDKRYALPTTIKALTDGLEKAQAEAEYQRDARTVAQSAVNHWMKKADEASAECLRLKEENRKLERQASSGTRATGWAVDKITASLGLPVGPGLTPSLQEIEGRIKELRDQERKLGVACDLGPTPMDPPPLSADDLPRPAALPAGYAFRVAEYVFGLACILTGKLDEEEENTDAE